MNKNFGTGICFCDLILPRFILEGDLPSIVNVNGILVVAVLGLLYLRIKLEIWSLGKYGWSYCGSC